MKVRPILAICALTLLMPGCASTSNKMVSANSYNDGLDHAYMAQIEKSADNFGAQIIWINPPEAKTKTVSFETHDN